MRRLSRRQRMVLAAIALFALITVLRSLSNSHGDAVLALNAVPVAIIAFEYGWRGGLIAAAIGFATVVVWAQETHLSALGFLARGFTYAGTALVVGMFADQLRAARFSAAVSEERAERLDLERRIAAETARMERNRLAQELHDVIAHGVSVMTVQATAARRVLASDEAGARAAIEAIETTGREALAEMRRMVTLLRPDGNGAGPDLEPQPGIKDIPALVAHMEAAGLRVQLDMSEAPTAVPRGLDLSIYRIVQEALTNVLKHAGPIEARLRLSYHADSIELEVCDPGPAGVRQPHPGGGGHGVIGMKERAALFGGELTAGPDAEGGFVVRGRFPIRQP